MNYNLKTQGVGFAPTNIALCKYWGKTNSELNLPATSSISIAIPSRGATTKVAISTEISSDQISLNNRMLLNTDQFFIRLTKFLDLFRPTTNTYFIVETNSNVPIAAGLASSACGFAAMVLALNDLFAWNLSKEQLSLRARLGSGSACRSLWNGFVEWEKGINSDGSDSMGKPLDINWPEFRLAMLAVDNREKPIGSRAAMELSRQTSPYYAAWLEQSAVDFINIKQALQDKNFSRLGKLVEANSEAMHAVMQTTVPSIVYSLPQTLAFKHKIWQLRKKDGIEIYFTQDAGANLKIIFENNNLDKIRQYLPEMELFL